MQPSVLRRNAALEEADVRTTAAEHDIDAPRHESSPSPSTSEPRPPPPPLAIYRTQPTQPTQPYRVGDRVETKWVISSKKKEDYSV